jgi:hypothetical protein
VVSPAPEASPAAKNAAPRAPKPSVTPKSPGPAPENTPPAKIVIPRTPKPAPATPAPKQSASPAPAETPVVSPKTTEENGGNSGGGMTGVVPFVPAQTPVRAATPRPISIEDQEAKDKARFNELKAQALQDPAIKALREKADTTAGEAGREAERTYDKALFDKVKQMDPSISDYVDRLEKYAMKRLEGGGSQ